MKKTPKGEISIDNKDFNIYTNIEGMCVPLKKSLRDTLISSIEEKNFFPYVDNNGKCGFFLRQSNGTFKTLSNLNWKNILNGNISKLRPKENMPIDNRTFVYDNDSNQKIKTCYWPDHYLESQTKNAKNAKKKTLGSNNDVNESKLAKLDGDPQVLSKFIKKATDNTSFDFLKSIEPTSRQNDHFGSLNTVNTNRPSLSSRNANNTTIIYQFDSISNDNNGPKISSTTLMDEMDFDGPSSFISDLDQVFGPSEHYVDPEPLHQNTQSAKKHDTNNNINNISINQKKEVTLEVEESIPNHSDTLPTSTTTTISMITNDNTQLITNDNNVVVSGSNGSKSSTQPNKKYFPIFNNVKKRKYTDSTTHGENENNDEPRSKKTKQK